LGAKKQVSRGKNRAVKAQDYRPFEDQYVFMYVRRSFWPAAVRISVILSYWGAESQKAG